MQRINKTKVRDEHMNQKIGQLSVLTEGRVLDKPIVFVHGFPYDHTMWKKQVEYFREKYFCVSYDVRGLGGSPAGSGQFTMESFVDDLESIIHKLKLEKPILCGLSMGGYISLRAIEKMQDNFGAVILCDTKPEADDNAGKLKRSAAIKRIGEEGLSGFVSEFVSLCFGEQYKQNHRAEFEMIVKKSLEYDPTGVKGSLLAMLSRTDTTDYLEKIKIPALIICGEQDTLTPPAVMQKMADKIKSSTFVEIKNSGHMSPIEQPEEVNSAISNFLESC